MMIRQDFENLPPKAFMMQIMDELSLEYCWLWDRKNSGNRVSLSWGEVTRAFQKNAFRSNLRKLNNKGLLSFAENEEGIDIELVGYDELLE